MRHRFLPTAEFVLVATSLLVWDAGCRRPSEAATTRPASRPATVRTPASQPDSGVPMDADTFAIVAHAVGVEARPIRYTQQTTEKVGQDFFPNPYLGPATLVDAPMEAALSAALLDPTTYDLGTQVMCFEPGVQFEFVAADGRRVVVKICFGCNMLRIVPADGAQKGPLFDFAPGHKRLAALVRAAFPNDADLRDVQ
jgi:hypothetical protein